MSEGSGGRSQESLRALKRVPISPTRLRSLSDQNADDSDFPTAAGAFAPAQVAAVPAASPQRPLSFNTPVAEYAPRAVNPYILEHGEPLTGSPLRPPPLRPTSRSAVPLVRGDSAMHAAESEAAAPADRPPADAVDYALLNNTGMHDDAASQESVEGDSAGIPEPMLSSLHSAPDSLISHHEPPDRKSTTLNMRSPRRGLVYASVSAKGVHIAIRYPEALQQALQPPLASRLSVDTEFPGGAPSVRTAPSVVHTVRTDRTRATVLAPVPSGPQANSAASPTASAATATATARVMLGGGVDGMSWRPEAQHARGSDAAGLSQRLASSDMHDTLYDRLHEHPPGGSHAAPSRTGSHAAPSRTGSVLTTPQVAAPVFYVPDKFLVCDGESAQQIYNRTLSREWEADDIFEGNPIHKLMLKGCEPFQTERLLGQNFKLATLKELQRLWVSTSDLASLLIHTIGAPGLTHLAIVSCPNLVEIPSTLQHLKALKSLVLDSCANLTSLDTVDRSVHWRELVLINCRKLSTQIALADFEGLHVLVVEDCPGVAVECKVPVEHPLEVLSLRNVASVVGGADGPALAPRKLRELRVEGDPHLRELPLAIDNLQHLRALSLRGCARLAGLPLGLAQHTLQRLNICLCWELEAALPAGDLLSMPCLLELCTSQPLEPEAVAKAHYLKALHLHSPEHVDVIDDSIGALTTLTSLSFKDSSKVKFIPDCIADLLSLRFLSFENCYMLSQLPDVNGLRAVENLDLSHCESLLSLPESIETMTAARSLTIDGCASISMLPHTISSMKALRRLSARDCRKLIRLPKSIGGLHALANLDLRGCETIRALPDSIEFLKSLRFLVLDGCIQLTQLPETLAKARNLRKLSLRRCRRLRALPASIGSAVALRHINVRGCESLETLPASVGELRYIACLDLTGCEALESLPDDISKMASLQSLVLDDCVSLKALPESLASMRTLRTLSVNQCRNLARLPKSVLLRPPEVKAVVHARHSGLPLVHGHDEWTIPEFYSCFKAAEHNAAIDRLLSDGPARRASLDSISLIATLLAVAASLAFLVTPAPLTAFAAEDEPDGYYPIPITAVSWLRVFFIADQTAFVLSMAVVVHVLVSSLPANTPADRPLAAGRIWARFVFLSVLLFAAIAAGMTAFFAAAASVYPTEFNETDIIFFVALAGLVMLIAGWNWALTLIRLYPGEDCMRAYGSHMLRGGLLGIRSVKQADPAPSMDEITRDLLVVAKRQASESERTNELLESYILGEKAKSRARARHYSSNQLQLQETSVTRTASSETEEETPATDLSQPSKYQTVQSHRSEDLGQDMPRLPPALMTPLRT
eukprot:jgi/Ulvmu1/6899/UM031_0105.1